MFRYETYDETVNVLNVLGYNGYRVVGMGTNMANRYSVTNKMSKQFWFLFMLTLIIFLSTFFQNRMMILKCICNIKKHDFFTGICFSKYAKSKWFKDDLEKSSISVFLLTFLLWTNIKYLLKIRYGVNSENPKTLKLEDDFMTQFMTLNSPVHMRCIYYAEQTGQFH